MRKRLACAAGLTLGALAILSAGDATASSHREAPFITRMPKVDGTDFYMFRSYDPAGIAKVGGATNPNVTIVANYLPLQDGYGGPNFFTLDSNALYEIHIDNTGDGVEDITFQFQFQNALNSDTNIPAAGVSAAAGSGIMLAIPDYNCTGTPAVCTKLATNTPVSIPFINANVAALAGEAARPGIAVANQNKYRNVHETYKVGIVRGPRRGAAATALTHGAGPAAPGGAADTFVKPMDFVGTKSFGANDAAENAAAVAAYHAYAQAHVYAVDIPGCTAPDNKARIFVGQRREAFGVLLGQIFDLVNATVGQLTLATTTGGKVWGGGFPSTNAVNPLSDKNVTSIAIEVPANCLQPSATEKVIGGWTTASIKQARAINPDSTYDKPSREGGAWVQVSRLGIPLVNEVGIGLKDKNKYNSSEPKNDVANFASYITHPTLPAVIEILFGSATAPAPRNVSATVASSRADLQTTLLLGITGVNKFSGAGAAAAEIVRLNAKGDFTAVGQGTPTPVTNQHPLGALLCFKADPAGTADSPKVLDPTGAACDVHGFPNGRRPGDDVVDIELRAFMGYLVASGTSAIAGAANAPLGDAIDQLPPGCTSRDDSAANGTVTAVCGPQEFPFLEDPVPGGVGL